MTSALEHPLPQNLEAEKFIFGAVILDNGVAPQALHELSPNDFFLESHRRIFRAMRALESRPSEINPLTLQDELQKSDSLDFIGGGAYIASLFDGVPRFSDIRDYVRLVKEASLKRQAIYAARWLENEAFAPDSRVDELLASLRGKVEGLEGAQIVDDLIPAEQAVDRAMANLEARWESGQEIMGLSTGLSDLDQNLLGLRGGKYYVLAAGTGIGKTALALSMASSIIESDNERVGLIISLEMQTDELTIRQLATATRMNSYNIETGRLSEQEKDFVREKAQALRGLKMEYLEGFSKVTANSLASRVQKVKRKYGRIDFLVVDYLQLLDSEERNENENARLTEISRSLKRIAVNYNIPVLVLSQLSRSHMSRANKDYILSDLRGSGSIEQDADVVMFLMPGDWSAPDDPSRRLVIAKHRGGKGGVSIPLVFFGAQYRFENAARGGEGAPDYIPAPITSKPPNSNGHRQAQRQRAVAEMEEYYDILD